jgi:hypothetical protein
MTLHRLGDEQVKCQTCGKYIVFSHLMQHIQQAHIDREKQVEAGVKAHRSTVRMPRGMYP